MDDNTFVRRIDAFTVQVVVERVGGYVTDGADSRWRLNGQNVVGQRVSNIADLARTEERDYAMPFDQQWLLGLLGGGQRLAPGITSDGDVETL